MFVILFTIKASQGLYLVIMKVVHSFGLKKFIDDCFISCIINTKTKKEKNNMKNVKTLLIFITISTFVFASTTRTDALGGAGFWADDYANVWNFPAAVNDHNVAYTSGNNFATIFDQDGTKWGFAGGRNDDEVVNMNWGNGSMGARVGLSMSPETADGADDAETGYNFGFGMPLAGMDFGFGYDDSGTIGVNLRRAQDIWLWENILVGFSMTPEDTDTGQPDEMGFSADCYANRSYGEGTNGLFALGFHYDVMGDDDATMNLVWNFGVESEMTDWATLRLGYATMYDAGGGDNTAGALQGGLGFNYDSFELDMALTSIPALVHDPVVYMTGRNQAPLGAAWTVTYSW